MKLRFTNTSKNRTKKQLYEVIPLGFNLQPSDYESHAPATQPQTLSNLQTVALNNAENRCYEVSNATDRDYKQVNTVRINKVRINILRSQALIEEIEEIKKSSQTANNQI